MKNKSILIILTVAALLIGVGVFTNNAVNANSRRTANAPEASSTLVISQAYSGGGSNTAGSGAVYQHDYVEIKNISSSAQSIGGLQLMYGSATGQFGSSAGNIFALPAATLNPGQYYLVELSNAGTVGAALPVTADAATTNLNMSGSNGKVALVSATFPGNTCGGTNTPCTLPNADIIDLVSWGTANNAEGGAATNGGASLDPSLGNVRKSNGCTDTDNNNADFDVLASPVPRNSQSAAAPCSGGGGPTLQHVYDFDGDGKTDFGVIRRVFSGTPGFHWFTAMNGSAVEQEVPWGLNDDFPAAGDYDGDHKTDYAVWRQATGIDSGYYILRSSDNTVQYVQFGLAGDDTTVVGDYTGDGIDDPAIYRPGASANDKSQFAYYASSGQYMNRIVIVEWGNGGDFALPGDFDGDGVADYGLIRAINGGTATVLMVAHGVGSGGIRPDITYTQFGTPDDYFVPGDFDGDGRTDFAVTRLENGATNWYILPSSGGPYYGFAWGYDTDVAVQGDYDGDGKTDVAVWRPGQSAQAPSVFYIVNSSGGVTVKYWGNGSDVPTAQDTH